VDGALTAAGYHATHRVMHGATRSDTMISRMHKAIATIAWLALTLGMVGQPAHARTEPARPPAQTSNSIKLALPIGTLELFDAQLQIQQAADKTPESFRGTARVKLPAVGPLANLNVPDLVRADVGLDKGSALTAFGAPLEPDRRYFFLSFGNGLNLSRQIKDDAGITQTLGISVPAGERVVMIVDPESPLLFLQGKFNVNYTGDLAVISQLLESRGVKVPGLENVKLPGMGTVVVSGTIAPGTNKSFIELSASTGLGAGPIGAIIGLQAQPLLVQGGARIDSAGATVTGITTSTVGTAASGGGQVQMRVPFDGQQPFIDLTGALSVPLAQVQTAGTQRVTLDGQAIADAVSASAELAKTGVKSAGDAITLTLSSVAATGSNAARAAGNAITVTVGAAAQAGGNVLAGVRDTLSGTIVAATPAITGAQAVVSDTVGSAPAAISSTWQNVMQQVCKATGGC
jgi:hypothetical protein